MQLIRFIALCTALAATNGHALLIRADRDDAEYVEMATRYVSSVAIDVPGGGEGVLITDRWILTSARVASALDAMKPQPTITVGGRATKVQGVFVHPVWRPGASSSDLGLIYLARNVSASPTPLYRGNEEGGKTVVIVGHGDTGRIGDKATRQDHKMRAGVNTVDRVGPRTLILTVKKGDDASDLQGAFTASESGGPAYYQNESQELFVAGIASHSQDDTQVYTRVSAFVEWIEETIDRAVKEELKNTFDRGG